MKEFDVIVIGSGPGGYVAGIRAAQLGLSTAVIEKDLTLGGTCLNVGCIPSKALLHTTELFYKVRDEGSVQGLISDGLHVDFPKMMEWKGSVVKGLTEGIAGLFRKNKIEWVKGTALLKSAHDVHVQQGDSLLELRAKSIILATGSEPIALPFMSFDETTIVSSTGALCLKEVPKKLIVVGAGAIGLEMGSVYRRLGSEVTVIEFLDRIAPLMDVALSKALHQSLLKQGFQFHLTTKVIAGNQKSKDNVVLTIENKEGTKSEVEGNVVLVSIGRRPVSKGLGLIELGIELDNKGYVKVNGQFQTTIPSVYAIGDLINGPMLAHKASEEGVAVAEILAGHQPHLNYMAIPNVIYTFPEVATVGLNEEEAKAAELTTLVGSFPFKANSRARCTGEDMGLVKIIAEANSHRIVGMHIVGPNASELIAVGVLAIEKKATLDELGNVCQAHPTLSEAIKEACLSALKRPIHF